MVTQQPGLGLPCHWREIAAAAARGREASGLLEPGMRAFTSLMEGLRDSHDARDACFNNACLVSYGRFPLRWGRTAFVGRARPLRAHTYNEAKEPSCLSCMSAKRRYVRAAAAPSPSLGTQSGRRMLRLSDLQDSSPVPHPALPESKATERFAPLATPRLGGGGAVGQNGLCRARLEGHAQQRCFFLSLLMRRRQSVQTTGTSEMIWDRRFK